MVVWSRLSAPGEADTSDPALQLAAGTACVRTRDRHVVNTAPLWGAVVALWVMEVFSARCAPPLDLGVRDHRSLDLVFESNENHNI